MKDEIRNTLPKNIDPLLGLWCIFEEPKSELNISDVSYKFIKNHFYTKYYKNGSKTIFKYKGKSTNKNMINVYMFCGLDGEEYQEDTEFCVSNTGTSEGSYIKKSTKKDIDFLISVSQNHQ